MPDPLQPTLERYLKQCAPVLRPASIKGKRIAIQNLVRYLLRHHPALHAWPQLRRPHIEGWLEHLHRLPLKSNSRRRYIRSVHLFFNELIAWQWPQAPRPGLIREEDLPPEEHTLPKPLPCQLDQAVQKALAASPSLQALALRLLRLTGMRLGEMCDLPLTALDESNPNGATLRVPMGKTRQERVIPVEFQAVEILHAILAQRGRNLLPAPVPQSVSHYLMLNTSGRRLHPNTYRVAMKNLTQHLSTTENLHPHRLRHTFATEMARAGMSLQVLMKILGHENPAMTMRYVHVAATDLRHHYEQALEKIKVLKNLNPLPLPLPFAQPNLHHLIEILITAIDSMRRNTADPHITPHFHRLAKRIRAVRDELKNLL